MAKTPATTGVKPGVIPVPLTAAKASTPKPNGSPMPQGEINPFVSAGLKKGGR